MLCKIDGADAVGDTDKDLRRSAACATVSPCELANSPAADFFCSRPATAFSEWLAERCKVRRADEEKDATCCDDDLGGLGGNANECGSEGVRASGACEPRGRFRTCFLAAMMDELCGRWTNTWACCPSGWYDPEEDGWSPVEEAWPECCEGYE